MDNFTPFDNPIADIAKHIRPIDEVFVICKDEKTIRRLMHEFADCIDLGHVDCARVYFSNNEIRFGNEVYIFTTYSKKEIALRVRRTIQVVYDYDFQKAIYDMKRRFENA